MRDNLSRSIVKQLVVGFRRGFDRFEEENKGHESAAKSVSPYHGDCEPER